jgi:hypothetical protein
MRNRAQKLSWPLVLMLLAGCTTAQADPEPAPSPAATMTPYSTEQMSDAIPARYQAVPLVRQMASYPIERWEPRADPLAGRKVEPEACRALIRAGGLTVAPGSSVPQYTPAARATAALGPVLGGVVPHVQVEVVQVTGAAADQYLDEYRKAGSECADIRVTGGRASVVERELAGFGERSRYIIRTYPVAGKAWNERILYYRTSRYAVRITLYGPASSEERFVAFAREVRDRICAKLG